MFTRHFKVVFLFLLAFSSQLFAQYRADYTAVQRQSNDTVYVDFQIRRDITIAPFLLADYTMVVEIDTNLLYLKTAKVVKQGAFGSTPDYFPLVMQFLSDGSISLFLDKRPFTAGNIVPTTFTPAGTIAFKVKNCGRSIVDFLKSGIGTSISRVDFPNGPEKINASEITPAPFPVSKTATYLPLKSSRDTICASNAAIKLSAPRGFNNYTLYSKATSGALTVVRASQADSIFNITVSATTDYVVTYGNTTCLDTTATKKIVIAAPNPPLNFALPSNICLGGTSSFNVNPPSSRLGNYFIWKLIAPTNTATFTSASEGVNRTAVSINFKGTSTYSAVLTVQDSNKYGCVSPVFSQTIRPIQCTYIIDFKANGSDKLITVCPGTKVTFTDNSSISNGNWFWEFGPGATPQTSNQKTQVVTFSTPGTINVKLTITDGNIQYKPTTREAVEVLAGLSSIPNPTCGSSACSEVNFNWPPVAGATTYKVRYYKNKTGIASAFQNIGLNTTFKITAAQVGGSLEFSDAKSDTVYFQVKAVSGTCDSTLSPFVFCKPAYCPPSSCNLPTLKVEPTVPTCKGNTATVRVTTNPPQLGQDIVFSWNNGRFDTTHTYTTVVTEDVSQVITLTLQDTLAPNCYTFNKIVIPVSPALTTKPELGIQDLECDRVTFVWKKVEGASKYQIKYSGTCIGNQDWIDAPQSGQALTYNVVGLTDSCKVNFQVKAVGSCNSTQSDTLISPKTCTCYIGHIASNNLKGCALDTATVKLSKIAIANPVISWMHNKAITTTSDTTFRFVPTKPNSIDTVFYTIKDLNTPGCETKGIILDTLKPTAPSASWSTDLKNVFCIRDAYYSFDKQTSYPGYTFLGKGMVLYKNNYYFHAATAGIGTHSITYNACGITESHPVTVVSTPCVEEVVGNTAFKDPSGLYTACDGTIYISDLDAIYKYSPSDFNGIPQLLVKSKNTYHQDVSSFSYALFGKPGGLVLDEKSNNELYFTDLTNAKIRVAIFDKQQIKYVAGSGFGDEPKEIKPIVPLINGKFNAPKEITMYPNMDTLYVADRDNINIKSFTFKVASPQIKLVAGKNTASPPPSPLPGLGKKVKFFPNYMAVDSFGINISDRINSSILRYQFKSDTVREILSTANGRSYVDGAAPTYRVNSVMGVTPQIGDWIYFADAGNFALRRINVKDYRVETVAGSPPPNNLPGSESGEPFQSRFKNPTAISFNIKGYIDILDGSVPTASVRRYYLPRWGVGTWNDFDSLYVSGCDSDTLKPEYKAGRLRLIKGDQGALIGNVFAPKVPGDYLLGYTIRIGRCDTTFFKTVKAVLPPRSALKGDTICGVNYTFTAAAKRDTSLRYKWFGPDDNKLPFTTVDTNRTITVTKSGRYWVKVFYGKKKDCSFSDSAIVKIMQASEGRIYKLPKVGTYVDSVVLCGDTATLSMEKLLPGQPNFISINWNTGQKGSQIKATGSRVYQATATDSIGCEIVAKFKVVNRPIPNICIKVVDATSSQQIGYWGKYKVSTVAGVAGVAGSADGKATASTFRSPVGLSIFRDTLYITDNNHVVRTLSLRDSVVRTLLGRAGDNNISSDSTVANARFNDPRSVTFDTKGNMYVANKGNHTIYKWDRQRNRFYKVAGIGIPGFLDGPGATAEINNPTGLISDVFDNIYFADNNNNTIRLIDPLGRVKVYAGSINGIAGAANGKSSLARLRNPWGLAIAPNGQMLVADEGNHAIRMISLDTLVRTVAGTLGSSGSAGSTPYVKTPAGNASVNKPAGVTVDQWGNVYFVDAENGLIRRLDRDGNVTTLAGKVGVSGAKDGLGDTATFNHPAGIAYHPSTGSLYVADNGNHTIRKLTREKTIYICEGTSYNLQDTCGAAGASWRIKRNGVVSNLPVPLALQGEATYIRTLTSCGRIIQDSVVVKYHPKDTTFAIIGPDPGPCRPKSINVTITPGYSEYKIVKRLATSSSVVATSTSNTITITLDNTFSNAIILAPMVKNKTTGCYDEATKGKGYLFKAKPLADFTIPTTCLGDTARFISDKTSITGTYFIYHWNFGDLSTATDTSISEDGEYKYQNAGTFNVTFVKEAYGNECKDTIVKQVKITKQPDVTLLTNGQDIDSLKFCGATNIKLNFKANFTPEPGATGPFIYNWFEPKNPGGGLNTASKTDISSAQPVQNTSQTSTLYTYAVSVQDGGGCASEPDTFSVRISTSPSFSVNTGSTLCMGQVATLKPVNNATTVPLPSDSNYVFRWDSLGTQINKDTNNPVLVTKPSKSFTYKVFIKDKITTCSTEVSVPVTVNGFQASIAAEGYPDPCLPPDSLRLEYAITKGALNGPSTILWRDSTEKKSYMLYPYNRDVTKVRMDTTRVYELIIRDNTCADTAYFRVPVASKKPPVFSVIQGSDTGVCVNGSVKVKLKVTAGEPPYNFTWTDQVTNQPVPEVNISDPLNPVIAAVSGAPTRTYVINMKDKFGCQQAIPQVVNIKVYTMDIDIVAAVTQLCRSIASPDPTASLAVTVVENNPTPPAPASIFNWKNSTSGTQMGSTPTTIATQKGWHVVTVTNPTTACVRRDSVYISILNTPENPVLTISNTGIICNNQPILLNTTLGGGKALEDSIVYKWSVSGGSNAILTTDSFAIYNPLLADTSLISFTVEAFNRCNTVTASSASIKLRPGPIAVLEASEMETFIGKDVVFTNRSLNSDSTNRLNTGDNNELSFGIGKDEIYNHPYNQDGEYKVVLVAFSKNGCAPSSDTLVIKVLNQRDVYLPNVFSPAAPDEENRTFKLYGTNLSPENFTFQVYNRWGQLVFSTTDLNKVLNEGWNGKDENGDSQMGVYTCAIKGKYRNGKLFEKVQTVTLLR